MSYLHPISDEELLLYHYKDGLDPARIVEIEDALFSAVELRERYEGLQHALAQVDAGTPAVPDADFEQRLWQALEPRIDALGRKHTSSTWRRRWRDAIATVAWPNAAFAAACVVVVAVAIGFYAGRSTTPEGASVAIAPVPADDASVRVLDAYVASHLRATEGLLLTASNSDSAEILAVNRELATSLVDSNRLYALAAARNGNLQLADFLRQIEPVLLGLANQTPDSVIQDNEGLREYLRKTDLIFQVRATQARMAADGALDS